ncbi:MAG: sigma-54-dependent Fis family transcriptional regulator [Nitrospinae bacterium]|nr:sigma-54-dependent Fis family transcriptional regulator [Nitrospinota bacterium]
MSTSELAPILIIDDDVSICKTLKLHFECQGHVVHQRHTGSEGIEMLEAFDTGVVILDIRLPDANGLDILESIHHQGSRFYSIIMTAYPDMESTVRAVQNGVGEYIYKPIDIHEIDSAVTKGIQFLTRDQKRTASMVPIPPPRATKPKFIGKSQAMKEIFKTVGMVSMSRTTVHIMGESGTGKELIARAIHQCSADAGQPFISINCSAIVETLLESELFGHEKGAFTGAVSRKEGKFALARSGVIFLDEIGEMDINIQAKLLRVLQEREYEMVGGKETFKSNCRVISATNRELSQMVKEKSFREDLYYRLNVISIHIPPLRDRREDIPDLALYFISSTCQSIGKEIRYISQDALNYLQEQSWTGNVRQLQNVLTNAVIMANTDRITLDQLLAISRPETALPQPAGEVFQASPVAEAPGTNGDYSPRSLHEVEKEQILKTLNHTRWHKGKTCDILGITRPRLERKIKKYRLKPEKIFSGSGMGDDSFADEG